MMGTGGRACLLSAVERPTGYVVLGQLATHTAVAYADRVIQLLRAQPRRVRTITGITARR